MNKQELIDILENLECSTESLSYDNGYEQGVYDSLSHVILLDEPKKVVVPKFVAEWIEYAKKKGDSLIDSFNPWDLYGAEYIDATRWIDNNQETFALAWVNGYEVEKEQLYYVDFINDGDVHKRLILDHENGKYNIVDWSDNLIGLVQEMFTEQEIKAIDERYWLFAVKVDGE
ncbi:DUF1642 domain-containing protein [Enterococcus faecalis]|nr:DUF1642 domain-containing protein [Enterococcus faecalis]